MKINFMKIALKEANKAFEKGEVPVGAIIVCENTIIAKTHNLIETLQDLTAHAEMLAISSANQYLGTKFLKNCELYVNLEPCVMCAGALYLTQIEKIIFGAKDTKRGFSNYYPNILNKKTKIVAGVLEDESKKILSSFFRKKRIKNTFY